MKLQSRKSERGASEKVEGLQIFHTRKASLQSSGENISGNLSALSFSAKPKVIYSCLAKYQKSGSSTLLSRLPGNFVVQNSFKKSDSTENYIKNASDKVLKKIVKLIKNHEEKEIKLIANSCKEIIKITVGNLLSELTQRELLVSLSENIINSCSSLCANFKATLSASRKYISEATAKRINKETECNLLVETHSPKKAQQISIGIIKRNHNIEKEQLLEKIAILNEHISKLNIKYESQYLESELEKNAKLETFSKKIVNDMEKDLKEKERAIIRLQYQLSEAAREISELKNQNIFRKRKQTLVKLSLTEASKVNENIHERNRELVEQVCMLSEELRNYLTVHVILHKTQEQLKIYQRRVSMDISNKIDLLGFEDPTNIIPNFSDNLLKDFRRASTMKSKIEAQSTVVHIIELGKRNLPHLGGIIKIKQNKKYVLPYKNWLELTIRGIYDSKYKEHLMCILETDRIPSNFTEFTYGWLGTFCVDEKYREIRSFSYWNRKKESTKKLFISALTNQFLKNSWEIDTFKKFFTEELNLDELEFFLRCRNLLFKGAELETSQGKYSKYGVITIDQAIQLIDKIFTRLSTKEVNELKALFRSKAKRRSIIYTISSSYVLRIMLECYCNEKRAKYKVIKELFQEYPKEILDNCEVSISFRSFKNICQKIDVKISDSFIVKLYRETYALGNGTITFDNFYSTANELGLFYKILKLRKNTNEEPWSINNYSNYNGFLRLTRVLENSIHRAGMCNFLESFEYFKEILESEGTYPLEDRQYWDIGSVLKHFLSMLCRFSVGYCETFASTAKCHADILQGISCTGYNFIFQDLERILLESVLIKIRKQISARAIQRFWRRKLKNKKIPYLF